MGAVYRARDARLNRDVAIKIAAAQQAFAATRSVNWSIMSLNAPRSVQWRRWT
jgi:hypothetical protein